MVAHRLADAWSKVDRAKHHADDLTAQMWQWVADNEQPYASVTKEYDHQEDCFVFRVGPRAITFPVEWSLILGDALNCYRCALDHLAWQLVDVGTARKPLKRPSRVYFPIVHEDDARFRTVIAARLPGVQPMHLAVVRRYQPYLWGVQSPNHPLHLLNSLVREDKHQRLHIVAAREEVWGSLGMRDVQNFEVSRVQYCTSAPGWQSNPGAELVRVYGRPIGDGEPKMQMGFRAVGTPSVEGGPGVEDVLKRIGVLVVGILREFDPLL